MQLMLAMELIEKRCKKAQEEPIFCCIPCPQRVAGKAKWDYTLEEEQDIGRE